MFGIGLDMRHVTVLSDRISDAGRECKVKD